MELYLFRHGIAAERGTYLDDGQRPLTDKGRAKTRKIADRLRDWNLRFEAIATSPLARAAQTADLLVAAGLGDRAETLDALAPGGSLDAAIAWLDDFRRDRADPGDAPPAIDDAPPARAVWVGHEPDLSHWAERLLWNASKATIVLKKAGIIGLSLPDRGSPVGRGRLFWLAPPRLML